MIGAFMLQQVAQHVAETTRVVVDTARAAGLPQPGVTAGGAKAIVVSLVRNPAMWLIVAFGVGSILEAVALVFLYRASDSARKRVSGIFLWTVHPFTGPDGRPSFSKIVDLLVIAAYWSGAAIPEGVPLMVIGSAHGTKILLAMIDKLSLGVTSAGTFARTLARTESTSDATTTTNVNQRTENITRAENITRTIDEKIGRGPTGEPLRSNPPVAGATTPSGDD